MVKRARVLQQENVSLKQEFGELKVRLDTLAKEKKHEIKSLKDLLDAKLKVLLMDT